MMKEKILIALGGNALFRKGEKGTDKDQLAHVANTALHILNILKEGYLVSITHGNGPQVGAILLQNELSKEKVPSMPLDICGSQSQGFIGYMIQRELYNIMEKIHDKREVVSLLTQVLVDKNDPAFKNPTKPIGLFYEKPEMEILKKEKGWEMVYEEGKGYRRVVPSPIPIDIIEGNVIKDLFDAGVIVVSCGGGGIPVIRKDGMLHGTEAVIDKDRTAAVLAKKIGADVLMILTDVEKVAINFGKENQENLENLTVEKAEEYIRTSQFGKGNMEPKVSAACQFVKQGGKKAIITSLEKSVEALMGKSGTHIIL